MAEPDRRAVSELAELLHDTAMRHDRFEKTHQKHDWWDWYAACLVARERGLDGDEAAAEATRYMEQEKGIKPL